MPKLLSLSIHVCTSHGHVVQMSEERYSNMLLYGQNNGTR